MISRSSLLLGAAAFGLGVLFGAGHWSGLADRHAKAAPGDAPGLAELTALQQGSVLLAKIAHQVTPSVVHIESRRDGQGKKQLEETGSGVIVVSSRAPGHYVVTNRHVIDGADLKDIAISLNDGRVIYPESVKTDKATDLAVLKISGAGLVPAKFGDSGQLEIGHMVLAVGSPFGLSQSVTFGIISAKGRRSLRLGAGAGSEVLNQDFLQTDAAINPGNSGGPLIDLQGRIIGINTAIASSSGGNEGIGFSIPSNLVQRVVDQLLEFGVVQRAYLGVKLDPNFDAKTAKRLGLDRVTGARVTSVYPNTPASTAGLQVDDVILSFDGTDVQDENHLINLVSLTPVGKQVRISIWRGGKKLQVQVLLTSRNETQTSELPMELPPGTPIQRLGLLVQPLESELAATLGYPEQTAGVLVLKIEAQSVLADQLHPCDVIEEFAHRPVHSVEDLQRALEDASGEQTLLLRIRRIADGETQEHLLIQQR